MHSLLLVTHFLGLSIGAGTGIYMAALSGYAAKLPDKAAAKAVMVGPGGVVSKVGMVGLVLLLLSGLGMVVVDSGSLSLGPAFTAKMVLVGLIVLYVGMVHRLAARARRDTTPQTAMLMKKIGPLGPLLALSTIVAAVLAFQ